MPIDEIIRLFDLPGINQSNARFDEKKACAREHGSTCSSCRPTY